MVPALNGRTIVVTRPRAQASQLAAWIRAQGGEALVLPLLEISAAADPAPLLVAIDRLDSYSLAIFISPNAVDYSLPAVLARRQWPAALRPVAIGPGTVTALAAHGVGEVLLPVERFDSESLLAIPELQAAAVRQRRVLILRGNGGRDLLADTLRARGAQVDAVACYRRSAPPDVAPLQALWRDARLDAIIVSSSEGLRNLVGLLDEHAIACLRMTPVFVPHQRIAELARALGLQQVIQSGPADAGIMVAIGAHDWRRQ
ncbi:MAG TPA: uroporphyrinogen-III synthase [Candidatus Accumulibacter phosphatis]|nr:MAG: Uroporphyrinogen-III synthase [Candidatus Accumulibacter sp. SK-11]HAY26104.1 uroporphyrinogen-III synthase [Accumulibacter sp.]HRL75571.1 uroporphyrinogen-III synthase [Candidatus Accumulibacter phosphatis]HCN67744.1 uroporphyrinogen-III synthase [Accumulibacter sp.]HCV14389.1 uroporphyrinogen-III synthase [Accumulibacter sp.]